MQKPPAPSAAALPASASARELLQPFRKDGLDLTVDAHGELQYRIAMQAGATLVYSWTASRGRGARINSRIKIRVAPPKRTALSSPILGLVPLAMEQPGRQSGHDSPEAERVLRTGNHAPASMPYDR